MELQIVMLWSVAYIFVVCFVLFALRKKIGRRTLFVAFVVVIVAPSFDAILSEIIFIATRFSYPKEIISNIACDNKYIVVGERCSIRSMESKASYELQSDRYTVLLLSAEYDRKCNNLMECRDLLSKDRTIGNSGYRYCVLTNRYSLLNVTFRRKTVFDISDGNILGESSDVSIYRTLPFFYYVFKTSFGSYTTSSAGSLCKFEHKVIVCGTN